jgi:hypothetical protein
MQKLGIIRGVRDRGVGAQAVTVGPGVWAVPPAVTVEALVGS